MTRKIPRPPDGLKAPGRAFWRSVVADYDLYENEFATLLEACRTKDTLADLQTILDQEGLMVDTPQGKRAHPAMVELRQQRAVYLRLLAGLRLPVAKDEAAKNPGRGRSGPREPREPNLSAVQ